MKLLCTTIKVPYIPVFIASFVRKLSDEYTGNALEHSFQQVNGAEKQLTETYELALLTTESSMYVPSYL